MCWGFSCGDGWYDLLDRLCGNIKRVVDAFNDAYGHTPKAVEYDVQAVQVKEKFGTLRFYTGGIHGDISDIIDALISQAEGQSAQTCEECGKHGMTRGRGWVRTLCTDCAVKQQYPIKEWELRYLPEEEHKNAIVINDKVAEVP
jgi:hypothetical protein